METEGDFRVIDPDTGKPRARGTEDWSDEEYRRWKKTPCFLRYNLLIPPVGWPAIALVAVLIAAAILRQPTG